MHFCRFFCLRYFPLESTFKKAALGNSSLDEAVGKEKRRLSINCALEKRLDFLLMTSINISELGLRSRKRTR